MKKVFFIIGFLFAIILQVSFVPNFTIFNTFVNLILVLVICFSLLDDYMSASIFAVVGGLAIDLYSAKSFGLTAISLLVVMGVMYLIIQTLAEKDNIISRIWIAGLASLVFSISMILFSVVFDLMQLSANSISFSANLIITIVISIIINIIFTLIFFPIIYRADSWLNKFEKKEGIRI